MKSVEVAAAIIYKEGKYFATQRGYGEFEGMWEFPGGKIEPGETPQEALKREIQEELCIDIEVKAHLCTTEYDYPTFHLTMYCYLCNIISGQIELREHKSALWLTSGSLDQVSWLPADKEVIEKIRSHKPSEPNQ
ncbi:MAG: 8-oxo-dGTP diphosphatase MutT [Bacteroidales bacterium]|nr:8-oxo-dGTP diphosphatase MutT [Bacteroidales bacterium]